ncbi:selenocysteine-specific translation elongation factor [Photobacterium lutimaris]|uniref:Selenocysteine-specific elongation factor n=1 Tax=Photobacterium lutimaris TaxID=388278 RepID=A0A2T3J334_9GAMM|nr:selenocysteine-specific translation elongation factor [Photobacterium lutimaris]PSU35704.1 selenocysteine-specific translation elongation factor [Photobacterium lutimaris]TDR78766.1 selenocysteine-specific translation elongation factor SelB [Photobacterium lutimaris]
MSYVVGTAGHVDHGKSALIKALTGIDTAHLPQEKKRGMTIDLGFAYFKHQNGEPVGVIDVPGHERFIRNMVAGVWSLDMVLFVVAADEGWMQMSTDHLKVIASMGIDNVTLVITKSDLVDDDMLALVEEESLEQFLDIAGFIPDSVTVSAHEDKGIERLRQYICHTLDKEIDSDREDAERHAHLYIDRVFTVNGVGTTVTGSLCGGEFAVGQKLYMLPGGREVQVKSLQSYHQNIELAKPVSRVAIGLKGIKKKDVERGFCLTRRKESSFVTDELIVRLDNQLFEGSSSGKPCRNNSEVELAFGTFNTLAKIFVFKGTNLARLRLKAPASCFWNQRALLIQHGGSRILNCGSIVWSGAVAKSDRNKLYELLMAMPEHPAWEDYVTINMALYGYAKRGEQVLDESGYQVCGDWLFTAECFNQTHQHVEDTLKLGLIDLSVNELSGKCQMAVAPLSAALDVLVEEGKLRRSNELYSLGSGQNEAQLSPTAKKILAHMDHAGQQGYEADKEKIPGAQKELRNLVRLGFAVPMEGKIYYLASVYQGLVHDLLQEQSVGDRFAISEARERTGLSRKYIIPLLNRMEADGWIKRVDNDRQVLKTLETECV